MGMRLHGAVLPGVRRRAGADLVHDHDVQGAAVAAIASERLCESLLFAARAARAGVQRATRGP
jgi:hypothetical protein